jgi:SAM-dependent methyltransferase
MSGDPHAIRAEGPNAQQITYWNQEAGPKWVEFQEALDQQIEPLGRAALDRAQPAPGERALDVGCGCGQTTLEIARRGGERGEVLGVDLSGPMLARARERAQAAGLGRARFLAADAQTHRFEPAHYQLVFSRFGVMFFENPVAAFRNLRAALAPGGRLAFLCWREIAQNPWVLEPMAALARHIPLPAPAAPDAPGPFAFASAERVRGILEQAGFGAVALEPQDAEMALAGGAGSGAHGGVLPADRPSGRRRPGGRRERPRAAAARGGRGAGQAPPPRRHLSRERYLDRHGLTRLARP